MNKTPIDFPPYGRMVAEFEADIEGGGSAPPDWHGPKDWLAWRGRAIDLLGLVLWPRYEPATRRWNGPAHAMMLPLTETDFALLARLRPVLMTTVQTGAGPVTHYELFQLEDAPDLRADDGSVLKPQSVHTTLRKYLKGLALPAVVEDLAKGYMRGLGGKAGTVDLEWKRELQRPRAYQMAVPLQVDGFTHQQATSAVTPSMISGHCFQMSMGGIAAFYKTRGLAVGEDFKTALAQHTVDVGDRRVFAGVHYPSDNISSWITALLVAPLTCPDLDGAKWLWAAVTARSRVYKAIADEVAAHPGSPYGPSLKVLKFLGENPGKAVDEAIAFASPSS